MALPECADKVVTFGIRLAQQDGQNFLGRFTSVQWLDQGLDDAGRAVESPQVAPHFQIMGSGHVPCGQGGGFIRVLAQVNAEFRLLNQVGKIKVCRSCVGRVSIQDEQCIHGPFVQVLDQVVEGSQLVDRIGFNRVCINHGAANRTQGLINGMRYGMDNGRLAFASNYQAGAPGRQQINRQGFDPILARKGCRGDSHLDPQPVGQGARKRLNISRTDRQAVIGVGTGQAETALDGVEPIHRAVRPIRLAPRPKILAVAQAANLTEKEVGVQSQDHPGFFKMILNFNGLAEDLRQVPAGQTERGILVPFGLGIFPQHGFDFGSQAWRSDRARQNAQVRPILGSHRRTEIPPCFGSSQGGDLLSPIRVV